MTPLVSEIKPVPALDDLLPQFADWPGLVVFDSAKTSPQLGRYSYLSADPFRTFELAQARPGIDPFAEIRAALAAYQTEINPDLHVSRRSRRSAVVRTRAVFREPAGGAAR